MILLLIVLLILPALFLIYKHKTHPKPALPPGPPALPFIGNLHQFDTATPHIYLSHLSEIYGPLVSLKLGSIPVLVVSSPDGAREVLKTQDLTFCSRPKSLGQQKISYNGLDIAFTPYSESWRELRKICVLNFLSNKQVQSFRPIREAEVLQMMKSLTVSAAAGEVINLNTVMMSLTSALICRVAFGKRVDEGRKKIRRKFDELTIECQAMLGGFFVSDYLPLFGWVDRVRGMTGRLDKVCKELDQFYQELIDEHMDARRQSSENPNNILDLLIQLKEDKSCSVCLTWDHVKALLMDIFVAGTDTSAAAVVWTMTALMQNPTTMKKLQNEIRESVGEKGEVNEDDLPKLVYLKAVIKESLRLYPPAPLLIHRETMKVCNIMGYTIPPKTMVIVNAWTIARHPDYWERPNEFEPERFLNSNMDISGQDFQVIPFGAGRRVCPGITMGLATVELALANLLYSFNWQLPPPMNRQDIDVDVLPGIAMHKKNPLCLVPITTPLHHM